MDALHALPTLYGYSIGGIVPREVIDRAALARRIENLEEEHHQLLANAESMLDNKRLRRPEIPETTYMAAREKERECKKHLESAKQQQEVNKVRDIYFPLRQQESLPLQEERFVIRQIDGASYTETMDCEVVDQLQDQAECRQKVKTFVNSLLIVSGLSNPLGERQLNIFSDQTFKRRTSYKMTLIASVITLPRVRVLDPVVLREGAEIGEEYKNNPDQYYVYTEDVLGGLFLAAGQEHQTHLDASDSSTASRIKQLQNLESIKVISYGAIAQSEHLNDIASIYHSWKNHLLSTRDTGYPVGFRYRSLRDIFIENRVPVGPKSTEKVDTPKDKEHIQQYWQQSSSSITGHLIDHSNIRMSDRSVWALYPPFSIAEGVLHVLFGQLINEQGRQIYKADAIQVHQEILAKIRDSTDQTIKNREFAKMGGPYQDDNLKLIAQLYNKRIYLFTCHDKNDYRLSFDTNPAQGNHPPFVLLRSADQNYFRCHFSRLDNP